MKIKGAMIILKKRAEFYGIDIDTLISKIDMTLLWCDHSPRTEPIKVLQAYEVYKMDQGYTWSGVNFETWVKKENI